MTALGLIISGSGVPTGVVVAGINALFLLLFFALLTSIVVSLVRIRRALTALVRRLEEPDHQGEAAQEARPIP